MAVFASASGVAVETEIYRRERCCDGIEQVQGSIDNDFTPKKAYPGNGRDF